MTLNSCYTFTVIQVSDGFYGKCLENDLTTKKFTSASEALIVLARTVAMAMEAAKKICEERGLTLTVNAAPKEFWDLAGKVNPNDKTS